MAEPKKKVSVELRSDEVKDILGQVPSWIIRWGMILVLVAISLILLGSYVFKYPKIIVSPIKVTTENPPSNIVAKTNGQIIALFVEDNQKVEAGQVLGIIENTSNFEHVQDLKASLGGFRERLQNLEKDTLYNFPKNLILGKIQSDYANFLKLYEDLVNFIRLDYHSQKISSLKREIDRFNAHSWTLKKQSRILKKERELAENQFSRDSVLYGKDVIPQSEYEKSKSNLLEKQRAYEQSRSILVNNDIQITRLEQQILDLQLSKNDEFGKLQLSVIEAFDNLVAEIAQWEQTYLLKTYISGIVSFTRIWSVNQNVRTGDLVMTVIPENAGDIIGKIELQVAGAGKVKAGQKVNVKFHNFPFMEYGMVVGEIQSVSLVTSNNAYSVMVRFPDGLKTTYNTEIMFSQDMQGQAEIITDDLRLIERIINPVKSVLNRQKSL